MPCHRGALIGISRTEIRPSTQVGRERPTWGLGSELRSQLCHTSTRRSSLQQLVKRHPSQPTRLTKYEGGLRIASPAHQERHCKSLLSEPPIQIGDVWQ